METTLQRKQKVAATLDLEVDMNSSVQLDIARLRELEVLVEIDLHGFSMFTRRATWSELGVHQKDLRRKRLNCGSNVMLPRERMRALRSLERGSVGRWRSIAFCWRGFGPGDGSRSPPATRGRPTGLSCRLSWGI